MKVWGLTGGVGMGKTAVAGILSNLGAEVLDTDDLARQLVRPGEAALKEIQAAFGDSVIDSGGHLRRDELARTVFADASARQKLEGILHPRIRQAWQSQIERWRNQGRSFAVIVIPLLFETNAESHFDKIGCVACLASTQHERLAARGWTGTQIEQRLAAQMPVSQKIARSDYVIWTEGRIESATAQVERLVRGG